MVLCIGIYTESATKPTTPSTIAREPGIGCIGITQRCDLGAFPWAGSHGGNGAALLGTEPPCAVALASPVIAGFCGSAHRCAGAAIRPAGVGPSVHRRGASPWSAGPARWVFAGRFSFRPSAQQRGQGAPELSVGGASMGIGDRRRHPGIGGPAGCLAAAWHAVAAVMGSAAGTRARRLGGLGGPAARWPDALLYPLHFRGG